MTACTKDRALKLDELQTADWVAAIRTAIIQLENPYAWLVKDPCKQEQVKKWTNHWRVSRGGFLNDNWQKFDAEINMLRVSIPKLTDAISIAQASECAANNLQKNTTKKNATKGELHLVAFSKVALCLAPEKAVVNDSWVRKYFFRTDSPKSNKMVAEAFEKEFKNRQQKIKRALFEYLRNGSKIPCRSRRQNCWSSLTLQRRVLDVAIMMAAGRGI